VGGGGQGSVKHSAVQQLDGSLAIGRLRVGPVILGYGSAGVCVWRCVVTST